VETLPVVKDFDPFKDHKARLLARGKLAAMDQLNQGWFISEKPGFLEVFVIF
jgi:hypothetical protein